MKYSIPVDRLDHKFVVDEALRPVAVSYSPSPQMIAWMHENADSPFRFAPIDECGGQRCIHIGFNIIGSPDDLTLFRMRFGF